MLNKNKQIDSFGSNTQKNGQANDRSLREKYDDPISNYFSYPIQPHYYPFHFGYPMGYSPFSYFSSNIMPPYDYYSTSEFQMNAKNLSPTVSKIQIKIQQKQIIDLESLANIKVQFSEEVHPKQEIQEVQEQPNKYNNKQVNNQQLIQNRKKCSNKNYERTINLDVLFKKIIHSFINQENNITIARLDFEKDLKKINELNENQVLMDEIFNIIKKKFAGFKKTKEEMIKYIIRRTYHNYKVSKNIECKPQFDRLQLFHDRNLSIHKSMNNDFLKKQFSNKLFLEIYKNFLNQMDQQFQKQNDQRIQKIITLLTSAWIERQARSIQSERKLPWTLSYKKKVKKIALELLRDYQQYAQDNKDKELN